MTTYKSECNCDIDTICVKCGVPSQPVETHSDMLVEIDNSPRGSLRSLLGAMNLDAAKPWVDEAINEVISSQRKELIEKIEGMKEQQHTCRDCTNYSDCEKQSLYIGAINYTIWKVLNLIKNND